METGGRTEKKNSQNRVASLRPMSINPRKNTQQTAETCVRKPSLLPSREADENDRRASRRTGDVEGVLRASCQSLSISQHLDRFFPLPPIFFPAVFTRLIEAPRVMKKINNK